MSEIKDIADMECDQLLEHIDLGKLDIIEFRMDGQDMLENLLGVIVTPTDDALSISGMAYL